VNRLGRSYGTQGDRKIHDLPPSSPRHYSAAEITLVSLFSRLHLSRAGESHTQPIRMETYNPTVMKPSRKVTCDSEFLTFFYIFNVFLQKYTLYKEMPEDKKIAKMLIEEYILW
jgi:hypothetical protein